MRRRELLQLSASVAALAVLPRDCHFPWSRVGKPLVGPSLTADQRAVVRAVADALLPRTATPGALDVRVPAFVDVIVAEHYGAEERNGLAEGLAHVETSAARLGLGGFATLRGTALATVMRSLEAPADAKAAGARGYLQLRALVLHAYFTSDLVQREVLRTQVMPGRFDGAAPMPARGGSVTDG